MNDGSEVKPEEKPQSNVDPSAEGCTNAAWVAFLLALFFLAITISSNFIPAVAPGWPEWLAWIAGPLGALGFVFFLLFMGSDGLSLEIRVVGTVLCVLLIMILSLLADGKRLEQRRRERAKHPTPQAIH